MRAHIQVRANFSMRAFEHEQTYFIQTHANFTVHAFKRARISARARIRAAPSLFFRKVLFARVARESRGELDVIITVKRDASVLPGKVVRDVQWGRGGAVGGCGGEGGTNEDVWFLQDPSADIFHLCFFPPGVWESCASSMHCHYATITALSRADKLPPACAES